MSSLKIVAMAQSPRQTIRPPGPASNRAGIHRILDAGCMAHVGFAVRGQPFVIPMLYAREGDNLLLQGSVESRLLYAVGRNVQICVSVALVDGLVLARSHLRHSMNYRSVVAFGRATVIDDPAAKGAALACFVDSLVPGRASEARPAVADELATTTLLRVVIDEASAKVRNGPPIDAKEDLDSPNWAGELPLRVGFDHVRPSPDLAAGLPLPNSLRRLLASGRSHSA